MKNLTIKMPKQAILAGKCNYARGLMDKMSKKHAERRAEIIKIARDLFLIQDYDKTTMQDFMDSLGVAKGTIYHYFKSKEDILEAVIEDIVNEHFKKMQLLIATTSGNALEKIKTIFEEGKKISDPTILEKLHKRGNEAMHTRLLVATLIKQAPLYAKLIEQGFDEALFKTSTPLEAAEFILSALQFLTDMGIYPWAQKDLIRRFNAFPGLIEALLQAPKDSFQFIQLV